MVTSLRNNARPRREIFRAYKAFVVTHQQLDGNKTFTAAQREAMHRKFREESRQNLKKTVKAVVVALSITAIILWVFGYWLVSLLTR